MKSMASGKAEARLRMILRRDRSGERPTDAQTLRSIEGIVREARSRNFSWREIADVITMAGYRKIAGSAFSEVDLRVFYARQKRLGQTAELDTPPSPISTEAPPRPSPRSVGDTLPPVSGRIGPEPKTGLDAVPSRPPRKGGSW